MMRALLPTFTILLLWFVGLLAGAQFAKIAVPIGEFRALYPNAGDSIAWLLTLVSVLGALFGVVAGLVTAKVGLKRVLFASLILGGGISIGQSFTPSFPILAFSRVFEGISHLGLVVTAPTLIAQIANNTWRGSAMALWSTFFGVSFALVAWFGTPFISGFGLGAFFQIHGGLMLLVCGVLALILRQPVPTSADTHKNPIRALFENTGKAYQTPSILWPGLSWLFYTLTFLALLTVLPEQLPPDGRATIATVMSLVGIGVSMLIIPIALQRLPATTVVLSAFVVAAIFILFSPGLDLTTRAIGLFCILGLIQGGTFAAVSQINEQPEQRALGFGIMAQTGNLGNLVGTPLMLFVLGAVDTSGLFLFAAGVYGVAAVLLFVIGRKITANPTGQ